MDIKCSCGCGRELEVLNHEENEKSIGLKLWDDKHKEWRDIYITPEVADELIEQIGDILEEIEEEEEEEPTQREEEWVASPLTSESVGRWLVQRARSLVLGGERKNE